MSHYVIAGSGLTGAVIARVLAEKGHSVTVLEKREHIGGNLYDERESHGFLVQKYGPHAFHTNDRAVWEFVSRFSRWEEYRLQCGAFWDGTFTPTPFNFSTVDAFFSPGKAAEIKNAFLRAYPGRKTVTVVEALKSPEPAVREYAGYLFEKDYSLYTAKQWGISPSEIDVSVLERVPLRLSYEEGYFDDAYQALPAEGYTVFLQNLLDHRNIETELHTDALAHFRIRGHEIQMDGAAAGDRLIYTGAADALFGYSLGALPYRSLSFEWVYDPGTVSFQKYALVAYPDRPGYTRINEYTKLPVQQGTGTVYAYEYPLPYEPGKTEPFYPVLTAESQERYSRYLALAEEISNLVLCGRLGDFRYYNMDQAIARALQTAGRL